MPTINKSQEKRSANPTLSSSSILSNSKWYLISFVLIIVVALAYQRLKVNRESSLANHQRLFTVDELKIFTKDDLYLAILGHVFNVSSAPKFYSQTGAYRYYTGRDASRSFHTGATTDNDLTDDLTGLGDEAIAGIYHWLTFYQKQYPQIGKLIGRYFTSDGLQTEHFSNVLKSVNAMKQKEEETARFAQQWPPCNSEWSHTSGKRVWCTNKSGGIERTWAGVPRRYFDRSGRTERCVCVNNVDHLDNSQFKEYPECLPTSFECRIIDESNKN